jgi:uncharacterized membrane protein YqjE
MAEPAVRPTSASGTDQSIGELVSVAARDISQLVRYELDLAKIELRGDVRRLATGAVLFVIGGFVACLVLFLLLIAFALGINAAGIWLWLSFVIAAVLALALAGLAGFIAFRLVRKLDGMHKTRRSVSDGISMLRHRGHKGAPADGARTQARAG